MTANDLNACLAELQAASGHALTAFEHADQVRDMVRQIWTALYDADMRTTDAVLTPDDDSQRQRHLVIAGEQCDTARRHAATAAALTRRIEGHLDAALGQVEQARRKLDHALDSQDSSVPLPVMDSAYLDAAIGDLIGQIDFARPLALSTRQYLERAATDAGQIADHAEQTPLPEANPFSTNRRVGSTARTIERVDETSHYLVLMAGRVHTHAESTVARAGYLARLHTPPRPRTPTPSPPSLPTCGTSRGMPR